MNIHRERLIAIAKTSLAAKDTKLNPATKKQTTTRRIASATQANSTRKVLSDTKPSVAQQSSAVQRPASAQAPVKPKTENVQTPASYISSTTIVASGDKGGSKSNYVRNPMAAQPHPAMAQSPTQAIVASIDLDFDINAEIAKLDEHLEAEAQDANQMCTIIPIKQEPETSTTIPIIIAVHCPPTTNYTTIPASETTTNDEVVLPTPVAAIKMEDHDADAAELNDLLASNSASEDHHAISNPLAGGDVGDVSEYLKNEYQNEYQNLYEMPPQQPQDSVMVTEHQQQIDINSCVPGVDTLNDPNSDPLANINHEIFIEPSDVPHTTMVLDPTSTNTTYVEFKQEYSEDVSATSSVQPSPNVSTVTTTATDVEKTVGSVKVN
jgi:hypothetical protein